MNILEILEPIGSSVEKIIAIVLANHFKEALDKVKTERKKELLALKTAHEEWLKTILGSLANQGYSEKYLQRFFADRTEELRNFLSDKEVITELLNPFFSATTKYKVDGDLLLQRWKDLELNQLPEDFDIEIVNRSYLARIKNKGIITKELRDLFLAQLAQERTNYIESIRGIWPDFDLDNYAKRVTKKYRVLDLSALTPPSRDDVDDGLILLQDVFVPQMVKEDRPPLELPKKTWQKLQDQGNISEIPTESELKRVQRRWEQSQPEPVLTVVTKPKNRCLILLGDPGSGKSTLARYLLLNLLDNFQTYEAFAGCLPLLVELRHYIGLEKRHTFLEYFHYLGKHEEYGLNHLELKELLQTSPALVIFDGLDEIFDPKQRDNVIQAIIGFATKYPKTRIVVTSRIVGYQGKSLQNADFREYTLQDLNLEQIQSFAKGWYSLVFRDKPEEANSRYKRIETALENSPAIRQLAGNPLLLTMIAIIAKHQELPRERAKLYDHAVKVLCHHWDVTGKHIENAPADFMREDDKLELLRRIAWRMQAGEKGLQGNFILYDDLLDEIAMYLRDRWQLSEVEIGQISHGMVQQLRERNFILCLYGTQVYGFVHRTFLEYFCAEGIVYRFEKLQTISFEQLKKDIFLAHFWDETWREVLRLVCGMIEYHFVRELMEFLIETTITGNDLFSDLKDWVFVQTCLNETSKIINTTLELEKFLNYTVHSDDEVIEYLASNSDYYPEAYSLLKQIVQNYGDDSIRHYSIQYLSTNNEYNTKTLPILRKIINNDKETSYIRSIAVAGLAIICSYEHIWEELLSENFSVESDNYSGYFMLYWLDSKTLIDKERVEQAAKKLNLPPETIRKHYEDIAKEIPLRLEWRE